MARTPRALARRIDGLARAAHLFHRYAHHPLCAEYRGELIALGRRARVCRGCSLVLAGAISGGALAFLVVLPPGPVLLVFFVGVALGAGSTFAERFRRARPVKLLSRFLPALTVAFALLRALAFGALGIAFAATGAALVALAMAGYRRRGPDRTPCTSCPERSGSRPCRGIAPIVRRERAFRRLAGQWLVRADS
jgi:hypothetical protein